MVRVGSAPPETDCTHAAYSANPCKRMTLRTDILKVGIGKIHLVAAIADSQS